MWLDKQGISFGTNKTPGEVTLLQNPVCIIFTNTDLTETKYRKP